MKLQSQWHARLKLRAESHKLMAQAHKLTVYGEKLRAESHKLWRDAVIQKYENVLVTWIYRDGDHDCVLGKDIYRHDEVEEARP